MKKQSSITAELEKATKGLMYMSESDYPLEPFVWEGQEKESLSAKALLKRIKRPPSTPVETVELEEFLGAQAKEQDWHDDQERKDAKRFQELIKMLKKRLKDIQVFKVGKRNLDVYVVGKTEDGDLAGLATKAVET